MQQKLFVTSTATENLRLMRACALITSCFAEKYRIGYGRFVDSFASEHARGHGGDALGRALRLLITRARRLLNINRRLPPTRLTLSSRG
jgi:hypothetical protein